MQRQLHITVRNMERSAGLIKGWNNRSVVRKANPRSVGLMRKVQRQTTQPEIGLKEPAKDRTHKSASGLREHLVSHGPIPLRPRHGA
jgi:hypothetical protein